MEPANRCVTCRFFVPKPVKDANAGECHRYAPSPLIGGSGTGWSNWKWPEVCVVDFCGEWQAVPDNGA